MMFRTSCRSIRDLLPLHVGGDLEPSKAAAVDEHLHRCLACFRSYREYLDLRGTLGVLADPPLPEGALDGFVEEVMARVALGETGPEAELPAPVARARLLPRLAAAAAVLLTVSAGYATWQAISGDGAVPGSPLSPAPSSRTIGEELAEANTPAVPAGHADAARSPTMPTVVGLPVSEGSDAPARLALPHGGADGVTIYVDQLPGGRRILRAAPGLPPGERFGSAPGEDGLVPDPGRELRPRSLLDRP